MEPKVVQLNLGREFITDERCFINEGWNSLEDESVSLARARVEPNVTTRWHFLEGCDERYLIVGGNGLVEIGDLEPCEVGIGDIVIIPSGCRQRITNCGDFDLVFYCVCTPRFRPEFYKECEPTGEGDRR